MMKPLKNLLTILLILLPLSAYAWGVVPTSGGVAAAGAPAATYLVNQNFEGTGYDNGESWTPSGSGVTPDYTSTALRGTQSLYIPSGDRSCSVSVSSSGEAWGHFLYDLTASTSEGAEVFALYNSATKLARITQNSNGTLNIKAEGGATGVGGTFSVTNNTTARVWWYFKPGTGANATFTVWAANASGGTSRPATADATSTDGTTTANINLLTFSNPYGGQPYIVDQVLITSSALTSVSE